MKKIIVLLIALLAVPAVIVSNAFAVEGIVWTRKEVFSENTMEKEQKIDPLVIYPDVEKNVFLDHIRVFLFVKRIHVKSIKKVFIPHMYEPKNI